VELNTIIGSRVDTSVDFNGLVVPANSVAHHIMSYTSPALFYTENNDPYSITKSGSLSKVRYKDRYFALATHHQVQGESYAFGQLCIHNIERKIFNTSNCVFFPDGDSSSKEEFDCLLFEFTEAVNGKGLSRIGWYDIENDLKRHKIPDSLAFCCIGYPGFRNIIDYEQESYIVAPNAVFGRESKPALRERLSFKPINEISYDPIGMSGGPVFGLTLENGTVAANFSGVLTNASRTCFNFISLQRIKSLFSLALAE
jgi:hypothetical protein